MHELLSSECKKSLKNEIDRTSKIETPRLEDAINLEAKIIVTGIKLDDRI